MARRAASALAVVLCASSAAHAEQIAFDNRDGTFEWDRFDAFFDGNGLDVTQPPTQSGTVIDRSLLWVHVDAFNFCQIGRGSIEAGGPGVRIALSSQSVVIGNSCGVERLFTPPALFDSGAIINARADWADSGDLYPVCFGPCGGDGSFLGAGGVVGLELDIDGQTHFGWVELETDGVSYLPVAWGYDTEPLTPIIVGCFADIDDDGTVGIRDLNAILGSWGRSVDPGTAGDITTDGLVNQADLNALLANWGVACD